MGVDDSRRSRWRGSGRPIRPSLWAGRAPASDADLAVGLLLATLLVYAAVAFAYAAAEISAGRGVDHGTLLGVRPREMPDALRFGGVALGVALPAAAAYIPWMLLRGIDRGLETLGIVGGAVISLITGYAAVASLAVSPDHGMAALACVVGSTAVVLLLADAAGRRRRHVRLWHGPRVSPAGRTVARIRTALILGSVLIILGVAARVMWSLLHSI